MSQRYSRETTWLSLTANTWCSSAADPGRALSGPRVAAPVLLLLQPQRTSSPSPSERPFSQSVHRTTGRLKIGCLPANSQTTAHAVSEGSAMSCTAHPTDGRAHVTSTKTRRIPNALGEKCAAGVVPAPSWHSVGEERLPGFPGSGEKDFPFL